MLFGDYQGHHCQEGYGGQQGSQTSRWAKKLKRYHCQHKHRGRGQRSRETKRGSGFGQKNVQVGNGGILNVVFTGVRRNALSDLATSHAVNSIPFYSECELVSFPLSGVIRNNMAGVNIVAGTGFRSLVSRINANGP